MADNWLARATPVSETPVSDWQSRATTVDTNNDESVVKNYLDNEEKYGTIGQQVITGLEGLASSATFGLSTGIETALGVDPEDIKKRRETNPLAYGAGQVAGVLVPGGLAGKALGAVGKGVAVGAEALMGAGKVAQVGTKAAALAAESAVFQSGDEVSKMFVDPERTLGTAMGEVGLATLIGGGTGVALGSVSPLWKATAGNKISKAIDDFKKGTVDPSLSAATGLAAEEKGLVGVLKAKKPNAKEIEAAAHEIGAPVLESQISANKHVQNIDSLLSQSPSPTGVARQQMIKEGFDAAENAVKGAIGDVPLMSEAEKGSLLKNALSKKFEAEYKPIQDLYEIVTQSTPHITVSPQSLKSIGRNISNLEEVTLSKSGPGASIAKRVLEDLPGITSVDKLKQYKTLLFDSLSPGASRAEKNVVNAIAEKLSNLEKNTIIRQAEELAAVTKDPKLKQSVLDLIPQRKAADAGYRALMEKASDLAEMLGRKRIRGYAGFQEFLEEGISAEKLAKRLFAKGDVEALTNFTKKFPEEANILFSQEKAAIRDAAMGGGRLNAKTAIGKVEALPKEVQEMMFSAQELKKLRAAQTYLEAMPKNINPSGTAITEEFYRFYGSPYSAAKGSLRDLGLNKIMKTLVKTGEEEAFFKSVFPTVAEQVAKQETSPTALKAAVDYAMQVVKGERKLYKASRAVFYPSREKLPSPSSERANRDRENLDKRLVEIRDNPDELFSTSGEVGHYLPDHASAMAETAMRAANYLNGLRPTQEKMAPLDPEMPVDPVKQAAFDRALDIAQNPLEVLESVKEGTVTFQDLTTLQNVAPGLYARMREKVNEEIISYTTEDGEIPYKTRLGLALFLGQPLDSTMTPQGIMAAQPKAPMMPPQQGAKPTQTGMQKLSKLGPANATQGQQREMGRAKHLG